MAESRVDVITEFILKKDKYLADLQGFGPQAQAIANGLDIKIPVSIADNFTAPLAAMKAAAVAPVVIPVVADTSVAQAQIAAVATAGAAATSASAVSSAGVRSSSGVGGGFASGAMAIVGGDPSWAVVGGRARGGPAAMTAEEEIAGMRQELGMTYGGRTDLSGDFAGASSFAPAAAGRGIGSLLNPNLPRMIGTGLAIHSVMRLGMGIGDEIDAKEGYGEYAKENDSVVAARDKLAADKKAQEAIHEYRWATLGGMYGLKVLGDKLGLDTHDLDYTDDIERDEKMLRETEAADKARERLERQRAGALKRAAHDTEELTLRDMSPLDRQAYHVNKEYDEAIKGTSLINNDTQRTAAQRNLAVLRESDLLDIKQQKDQQSVGMLMQRNEYELEGSGNTTEARFAQLNHQLLDRRNQVAKDHGDVRGEDINAQAAQQAFWMTESRARVYEQSVGAGRIKDIEGEMSESSLRFGGDRTGADRAELVRSGADKVSDLRAQADAMGELTEGTKEYIQQQNLRAEADMRVKKNAQDLAQFDATTARQQTQSIAAMQAQATITNQRAGGDIGGANSAAFAERQREALEAYSDPAAGHTPTQIEAFKLAQAAERNVQQADVRRQAQSIGLQTLQTAAVINPSLRQMAGYESLREHIINEQQNAAPENKDLVDRLARVQIEAFKSETMAGGWHGTQTFNGTKAMTDIVRQSQQMSGPDYMQSKMKIIDDKLGLYFGDNLKSDFGASPDNDMAKAITKAITDVLSGLNLQKVGIIRF